MNIAIIGGAGFIGSHLAEKILEKHKVMVLDNLSTGSEKNIVKCIDKEDFKFHRVNVLEEEIYPFLKDIDTVFHLAANPDVRTGVINPKSHINDIIITYNILESMRKNNVKKIVFASTSTVYGEAETPTTENHTLRPISLYGASKAACESLISSYSHTFGMKSWIFRFANVVGKRSNHGVICDFIKKLKNPEKLEILGDGNQKKSYIYIDDCIDGMLFLKENSNEKVNIFNLGTEDWITVKRIAEIVAQGMNLHPEFEYTGGERGWVGDVPKMLLSIKKAKTYKWKPRFTSEQAIAKAVKDLLGS